MGSENKTLARIAGLLNKAENTDNSIERDTYMERAQELATLGSIDLAKARAFTAQRHAAAKPIQRAITIGESRQRGLRTYVDLFVGIAGANDVSIDVARNATKVYAFGFAEDIDVAEALYASLLTQMVSACNAFLATGEYKNETTYRKVSVFDEIFEEASCDRRRVPISKITARLEFQTAYASRVVFRLWEAKRSAETDAIAHDTTNPESGTPGTALVLAQKRTTVENYYKDSSTARGSYRGHRSTSESRIGRDAGDRAGRTARLAEPTSIAGAGGAIEQAAS